LSVVSVVTEPVQPVTIQAITAPVSKAYALLAGLQLGLFTALEDGPRTLDQLAAAVGGEPRRLRGLLFYLTRIGLLTAADGQFSNTAEADCYLVRGRPGSLVESAGFWAELWGAYATTAASIRAGRALADHGYADLPQDERDVLYRAYDATTRARGIWLADTFDFADCRTLVDVGGGSGGLAAALTERHPHIRATVADLPPALLLTERFLAGAGATARVGVLPLDLLAEPLQGVYDVAVLSNVLQVLDPDDAAQTLRHIGAAVSPGGRLYILGHMLQDNLLDPEGGAFFNFAAIGFYQRGLAHTESELRTWLEDAGFEEVEFRWGVPAGASAVIARKRT
jgi:3-hydroxy-5-methyl-1-naphthoate 3-O-methyltransferase